MSHSKGFFGTCPGNFRKYRKPVERYGHMEQQERCTRCGKVRMTRVKRCWMFHQYRDDGRPEEGLQKQKCAKCADKRNVSARRCRGWFGSGCSFHKCSEQSELHCRYCSATRD